MPTNPSELRGKMTQQSLPLLMQWRRRVWAAAAAAVGAVVVLASIALDGHAAAGALSALVFGAFVDGAGVAYPTTLHQVGAEAVGTLYTDAFDTTIMMNVLEHCVNAYEVLESLYNVTKPGGILILWEPTYSPWFDWYSQAGQNLLLDTSLPIKPEVRSPTWAEPATRASIRSRAFDMTAHPLRVGPSVFEHFAAHFEPLLLRTDGGRRGDRAFTLVGRKRAP